MLAVQRCLSEGSWAGESTNSRDWRGGTGCSLSHPLRGSFNGVFADTEQPLLMHVLGDSVGAQMRQAVEESMQANSQLRALEIVNHRQRDPYGKFGMSVIPRSAAGCMSSMLALAGTLQSLSLC